MLGLNGGWVGGEESVSERVRGRVRVDAAMQRVRVCVDVCGLRDPLK